MPRARSPNREKAFLLWKSSKGKKRNKDIAAELDVSESIVSRWKKEDDWEGKRTKKFTNRNSKSNCKEKSSTKKEETIKNRIVKSVEENEELTEKQRLFCIYWMKNHNATQAYFKAYFCTYHTACTEGPRNLIKPVIKEEIERLKKIRNESLLIEPEDIVERYMKIAFSDITDFAVLLNGNAYIMNSNMIDGGIIAEIKQTQFGAGIKLENRQKAMEWLSDYFNMNPMNTHKRMYDKKILELKERMVRKAEEESGW